MAFKSFFATTTQTGPTQDELDRQYAMERYNSDPAYWEAEARKANPNFPNIMGQDFTNSYYTNLAQDLAGTEGMRAARMQGIAHDGGISQYTGGVTDVATLGVASAAFGVGGATGAAAATGNDIETAVAMDMAALAAAPTLGGAGLGTVAGAAPYSEMAAAEATMAAGGGGIAAGGSGVVAGGMTAMEMASMAGVAAQVAPLFAGMPEMPAMGGGADVGAAAKDMGMADRGQQMETRKQRAGAAARGASATRSGNNADLLGKTGYGVTPRARKGTQRTLGGS